MKIHAFGDSFVMGDQDDYNDRMTGQEHVAHTEWLRYNVSFPALIAKSLGIPLTNYAVRGSGNFPQLDELWLAIHNQKISSEDVVLFGITAVGRDRSSLREFEKSTGVQFGPCMVKRSLLTQHKFDIVSSMDYYYIISVLQSLKKAFDLNIVIFNIFDSPVTWVPQSCVNMFDLSDLMLNRQQGNTLVDILNDTWGHATHHPYHVDLSVPAGYEHLYTTHKHPSVEGHKKIAQWFLANVPELQP